MKILKTLKNCTFPFHLARFLWFSAALVSLIFGIVGSPMPYFHQGSQCYNAWGYKEDCTSVQYTTLTNDLRLCQTLVQYLQVGATFEILGNLTMGFALIVATIGLFVVKKRWCKIVTMVFSIAAAVSWVFVVAFMTGSWDINVCFAYNSLGSFKDQMWGLSSGAALLIIAWLFATGSAVVWFFLDPEFEKNDDEVKEVA